MKKKFSKMNRIFEEIMGTEHNLKSIDVRTGKKEYYVDNDNGDDNYEARAWNLTG